MSGIIELRERPRAYSLGIIRCYATLPKTDEARVIGRQLLRSGTSVGAHHREAHRARATAECISKMETGLQELDETDYWLDLIAAADIAGGDGVSKLWGETNELIAIFASSVKTAERRGKQD